MNMWVMWVASGAALAGAELINRRMRAGFAVWLVTNAVFVVNNVAIGQWAQAALFGAYFVLAVRGWVSWRRDVVEAN